MMSKESASHSHIEIKTRAEHGGMFTEVFVDGHKLNGVRRYELKHGGANQCPTLTLDLNALGISVDSPAILRHEGMGEIEVKFKK